MSIKDDGHVMDVNSCRVTSSRSCVRVAHLHSSLGVYGAERWTLALIRNLDLEKFDPLVISVGTKPGADSFFRFLKSVGIRAEHIAVPGRINPRAIIQLRSILVSHHADVLHTHGFKADVLGYLATRGTSIPVVSTIHGWSAREGGVIRFYEMIDREFLKRFDCIYPLSSQLYEDVLKRGFNSSRVRLVLNGVDMTGLDYQFKEREESGALSVLFAGRVCQAKGILDLIAGLAEARCKKSIRLIVVGDGPDRERAEEMAEHLSVDCLVEFVGMVPTITPYLRNSNVLVLPSYSEGIPRVVMESFAAGVPVIGTDIPGIRQLIEHEVTGLLVPVGDPPAIARSLERLFMDIELARYISSRAQLFIRDKFSACRMARDFQDEYHRLLSSSGMNPMLESQRKMEELDV